MAQNSLGMTKGAHRTFKTKPQPLGVTLAATPNPAKAGTPTVLAGQLTGTNNANRGVVLQSNPFPYLQGFANVGNALITDAAGNFTFQLLALPVTTQFRVVMTQNPAVVSPVVVAGAALRVGTSKKKVARYRHSVTVRFRGSVSPQFDGGEISIQRLQGGVWVEKAHTFAKDRRLQVALPQAAARPPLGPYRVVAQSDGQYVSGTGRTVTIRAPR